MESPREEELFLELKAGSQQAFRKVYEQHRERFINFARKYSLGDEDILDVYQDSYIVFYENIQKGKLKELTSSIATYLTAIGKYKIMERLRASAKKRNTTAPLELVREESSVLEEFELEENQPTSQQERIIEHLAALGPKCQEILKMFYYRGMNIKEIMRAGNYNSENVVKSQKSRCLKTLREAIQKSYSS